MNVTDYSYSRAFETKMCAMGLNRGIFSFNDNGYINPIVNHIYSIWVLDENSLTTYHVKKLVEGLK